MSSFCTNCAAILEPGMKFCGACGNAIDFPTTSPAVVAQSARTLPTAGRSRRYPALRIIAFVFKIIAVLTAVVGLIIGLSAASIANSLPTSAGMGGAGPAIGWIIFLVSLCYALFLWAASEMIHVLIDIEENTRRGAGFTG